MATPSKEEVLSFDVLVDIRASLKAMEKFSKSMKKSMKEIAQGGQRMGKENEKASKQGKKATDEWGDSVEKLNDAYEYHDKLLKQRGDSLRELRALYAQADKAAQQHLGKQIEFLEQNYKLQLKAAKVAKTTRLKGGLASRALAPGLRRALINARDIGGDREGNQGMKNALKKAGEALRDPLEAFLKKDAGGLVEVAGKGFAASIARGFHGGRLFSRVGGRLLKGRGERAMIAGQATGGVKGALQQAGGAGMKGVGELLSGISRIMRPLATLGPLLQASIMGLVKLFIDLDAEVREFNKGIMESASNLEFLARSGGHVGAAVMDMKDALDGVRRAATDASFNNALGITKETHTAILNTLTQEGVALGRVTAEAGNTAKGMKDATQTIVKMGVAYSRGLGVPLQEITSLQAEMMVEMGKSVEETGQSFAMMTSAAAQSGIAGNKFFNIIRGLSTDLGLFNLRLEDSVAVLGKIGKVMSPRNAQKFMQEASQGLRSMGRQERLKLSLFAGSGKTQEVVKKDIDRKSAALISKIAAKTGENEKDLLSRFESKGYAGIKSSIDQFGKESGTLAQSALEIENQRTQAKKGQYGTAMATADLGVGGSAEMMRSALTMLSKGKYKSISEALGSMELEQVAENLGKSDEQVKQAAILEKAVEAQREDLKQRKGADVEEIGKMGWDDIIATMTDDMKKGIGADPDGRSMEQKMFDLAGEQGQMTQSIQEKLENLVDWFMNTLYDLLIDIYDAIMSLPGMPGTKGKRDVYKTGNSELIRAFDKSLDKDGSLNLLSLKDKVVGPGGGLGRQLDRLSGTKEGRGRIASSVQSNMSGRDVLAMAKASNLDPAKYDKLFGKLQTLITTNVNPTTGMATPIYGPAMKGQLGDLLKTFEEIGLTEKEQADLLAKAGWGAGDIGGVTGLVKDLGTAPGTTAAAEAPGSAAKETAAAATATSEQLTVVAGETKKTQGILQQQGIKVAPATLKEEAKGMEASMLSALRTALFEYYMYSGTDRGTLLTAMNAGGVTDPRQMAQRFGAASVGTGSTLGALDSLATPVVAQGNAAGGLVTGISRGLAVVAAQGEGLASVGKGERIVPAGGGSGGGGVNVVVNGIGGPDLARLIEGKVVEGIREYRRREKYN